MAPELLDIQPRELKFTKLTDEEAIRDIQEREIDRAKSLEVKKQSSCSIQLQNNSDQYVAFKVKTTNPKKYCVRPNLGVIQPSETCYFKVVMQAPRAAPHDLHCKDKFLVQSTVVPFGTVEEDLTPETFGRDSNKHIEDKKLRVVLVSAPSSPVSHPMSGWVNPVPNYETTAQKQEFPGGVENLPSPSKELNHAEVYETVNNIEKLGASKDSDKYRAAKVEEGEDGNSSRAENNMKMFENAKTDSFSAVMDGLKVASNTDDLRAKNVDLGSSENVEKVKQGLDNERLKLAEELKDLKSKHNFMETKLREAELIIRKLTEERSTIAQEKNKVTRELETMRKGNMKTVQVGFPFLYVCMVAIVSVFVGYLIHS